MAADRQATANEAKASGRASAITEARRRNQHLPQSPRTTPTRLLAKSARPIDGAAPKRRGGTTPADRWATARAAQVKGTTPAGIEAQEAWR